MRALAGLASGAPDPETVRLDALLVVDAEGRATLVDRSLEREVWHLEPRLRRRGWTVVDALVVPVSVPAASVSLPDAIVASGIDRAAFLERWPIGPGDDPADALHLPLRAVVYAGPDGSRSRAETTAHLARFLARPDHTVLGDDVARLAELTASIPMAPSAPGDHAALMQILARPWVGVQEIGTQTSV